MAQMTILLLLVLGGFVWYVMEPGERTRFRRTVMGVAGRAARLATRRGPEWERLDSALRARTRLALVTLALVVLNVMVFLLMLAGQGALAAPSTLIAWGGNFGPSTGNGEWSRLVTSLFVHSGPLHLLVNVLALMQVGLLLERLVGHLAFAVVYLTAGVFASVVSLYADPVHVSVGASGAVSGVYGLLLAVWIWGLLRRSAVTIPLNCVKTFAPVAAVFVLYNGAEGSIQSAAEWVGLAAGFIGGMVLASDVSERKPRLRSVAAAAAAALVIAAGSAVPLRGIANVRPELERLVEMESRMAAAYEQTVKQFRLGAMNQEQLAQAVDRTITPELKAAKARLEGLTGVPPEQQTLVAGAEEYLRLREESWQMRSEALHKADMRALHAADQIEQASLEALDRIRAALADGRQ